MSTVPANSRVRSRYHYQAYQFVFEALTFTLERLRKDSGLASGSGEAAGVEVPETEDVHITGAELLSGIRDLALQSFGMMSLTVFRQWGVSSTSDFGHIVFELIERGEMQKTEQDRIEDFYGVYDFREEFEAGYEISLDRAFSC